MLREIQKEGFMRILFFSLILGFTSVTFSRPTEGQRLLNQAIMSNDVSTVKQTLQLRFDINEKSEQGLYPIHVASKKDVKDEILELLLKAGANPNLQNGLGQTPLHLALLENSTHKVDLLLKAQANPSIADRRGNTALHLAAENNTSGEIKILLASSQVKIDLRNDRGYTALMLACLRFHPSPESVEALLKAGADRTILQFGRFTAQDFAEGMRDYFKKNPERFALELEAQEKIVKYFSLFDAKF